MITIRTAEDWARALEHYADTLLGQRLEVHHEALQAHSYIPPEDLALLLIVGPGDTLEAINAANPVALTQGSYFAWLPEVVERHGNWLELLFILSDDGFGMILFVPWSTDIDSNLLSACQALSPDLDPPADRQGKS